MRSILSRSRARAVGTRPPPFAAESLEQRTLLAISFGPPAVTPSLADWPRLMATGDFNNDGRSDLAYADPAAPAASSSVYILVNGGATSARRPPRPPAGSAPSLSPSPTSTGTAMTTS